MRVHVTVPGNESNPLEVTSRDTRQFARILTVTRTQGASLLPFGDSDKVAISDKVYLVGDSASQVAAPERNLAKIVILNEGRYFQVAAPLSSASRGGPVLNSKGEVIGIAGEGFDGLNETFVIPAAYLTTLLRDRNVEKAGRGMGSGGGIGPAPSTGPGQGSGGLPVPYSMVIQMEFNLR